MYRRKKASGSLVLEQVEMGPETARKAAGAEPLVDVGFLVRSWSQVVRRPGRVRRAASQQDQRRLRKDDYELSRVALLGWR